MKNQHDVLEDGHYPGSPDIRHPDQQCNCDDEESALPVSVGVVVVRFPNHGLDESSD